MDGDARLPPIVYHALAFVCMLQLPLALLVSPHITRPMILWSVLLVPTLVDNTHGNNTTNRSSSSSSIATHSSSGSSHEEGNSTAALNTSSSPPSSSYYSPDAYEWNPNGIAQLRSEVYTLHMETEYYLGGALVGAWACVYLYLGVLDERHNFSGQPDDAAETEEGCDEDEDGVARWIELARVGFWVYVALQTRLLWSPTVWTVAELQWRVALRTGALYALTRTFKGRRRIRLFHVFGAAIYLWTACEVWPVLTLALAVPDALLVLGHMYDRVTPIRTVLNTRLFYLALTSSVALSSLLWTRSVATAPLSTSSSSSSGGGGGVP
jgi:hypothetical protein